MTTVAEMYQEFIVCQRQCLPLYIYYPVSYSQLSQELGGIVTRILQMGLRVVNC